MKILAQTDEKNIPKGLQDGRNKVTKRRKQRWFKPTA